MCIGGRLGAEIDLDKVPACGCASVLELLYSESASRLIVAVAPDKAGAFEALFAGQQYACIGVVTDGTLCITCSTGPVLSVPVETLAQAFKAPLNW